MGHTDKKDAEYLRYKNIKKRFDIRHRNYELQQVFSHEILRICFHKKWPKIKSLFRWFVIPSPSFMKPYVKNEVILFSNLYYERKDYKNFLDKIINEIKKPLAVFNYKYRNKIRLVLNIKNIFSSIVEVLKRNEGLKITEQIYYAASLTYIKNYLDMLEKHILPYIKIKAFVAFNSSVTPDSIVTVFFRSNKIPTFSLQHGAYVEYGRKVQMDVTNYENVTADKILCWGKNSAELFNKYGLEYSRIVICGNPKYKETYIDKIPDSFKKGLVLLPRWVYDQENVKLIELLGVYKKRYKVDFYIKLHPSLNNEKYKQITAKQDLYFIEKDLLLPSLLKSGKFDFAISYNSTAYYEPMFYGIPSLRYAYHENEQYGGLDDKFNTAEELHDLIGKYKNRNQDDLKNEIKDLLFYVFGTGNLNYDFLDTL